MRDIDFVDSQNYICMVEMSNIRLQIYKVSRTKCKDGRGKFYIQGGRYMSCATRVGDADMIVACKRLLDRHIDIVHMQV